MTNQTIFSEAIDDCLRGAGYDLENSYEYYDVALDISLEDIAETMWALGNFAMACQEDQ